jgi:hypothetical protein
MDDGTTVVHGLSMDGIENEKREERACINLHV